MPHEANGTVRADAEHFQTDLFESSVLQIQKIIFLQDKSMLHFLSPDHNVSV
jgi:hypothetical protein